MAIMLCYIALSKRSKKRKRSWDCYERSLIREVHFRRIIYVSDLACIENTRMDRAAFHKLCDMLQVIGGLHPTRHMCVEELVAMFLHILAHHVKNRMIRRQFVRSGETISRHFINVLLSVLRCHKELLKQPKPILEGSTDERWKYFKNCLGALDGTYIKVNVPEADKSRYRTRKGEIATNVLGVCSPDLKFIYVLPGWEGSAADSRVLRDAISRPNGLKVPQGYYYLCDAGYMNGEGFLTPYRGQRYHLSEWRNGLQPTTPKEFFNMKHSSARNVIERCFGLLKGRWAILREKSFYPIKTQGRIITACCLLHNHIRKEMALDPLERNLGYDEVSDEVMAGDMITTVEPSTTWSQWRDNFALEIFNRWRGGNH
ncbi:hypothetical protein QL285_054599 [Trifolium repens]|nr:hypothetical protein QL285_054599 [Trifolium repens]